MDVDRRTQQRGGHAAAFDMPAGVAFAPGGGPAHKVAGVGLPEEKVGGVFLGGLGGSAAARAVREFVDGVAGEFAVVGEGGDGVVDDAIFANVGVALFDQGLDHVDEGGDELCGAGHDFLFHVFR